MLEQDATATLDLRTEASVADDSPPVPVAGCPARWGRRLLGSVALVTLAQAVVALDLDLPAVRPLLALVTFVALPAVVLYRRAGIPADSAVARGLYGAGLALLGLLLGGLLLDTTLPLVGVDRPLAPAPLAVTWLLVDVALLAWRPSVPLLPPGAARAALAGAVGARLEVAQALAVAALLLSVLGAMRLNNGAGGGVAVVAAAVAAGALLALLLAGPPSLGRDVRTLGLVAASLLLATSLRGWGITGHDIQAEFLVFRLTNGAQDWEMSALPSAYNACLSVNILPTVLAQTTGLSGEVVFKALLQLVFAAVPVLTYLFARRVVARRHALVGTILTLTFPTFFTDMPYLVRQEVAFFFLALVLLAATEPGRTRVATRALVLAFATGVILSHYSTTYVLLMALVAALLGLIAASVIRRARGGPEPEETNKPLVLLHPVMVAVILALTLGWAGPVTDTGGHAMSVVKETVRVITGDGDAGPGSSDTSYWILAGDGTTPEERMELFVDETLAYRDREIPPDERVLPHPGPRALSPEVHDASTARLTPVGRALDDAGIDPTAVNEGAKIACAVVMQLFVLLGMVWLLRRRPSRPSREVTLLTCGAVSALALIVLVPNLSVDYGVLRAFQQTLLVIAPVMAMGLGLALRPLTGRARLSTALTAVVPVLLLGILSGALPAVLGGQQQRMALANAGSYYDRFFASDSAMQAMRWLGSVDRADRSNERIIANRNVNVRLLALSDNRAPVSDRLFPTLLSNDAYVFVDGQILDQGASTVFYTGDLLTYTYPIEALDERLDLVYSAPQARIYR